MPNDPHTGCSFCPGLENFTDFGTQRPKNPLDAGISD